MSDRDSRNENPTAADEALAEYFRRLDRGETVDVEAFCTEYPDAATAIRDYVSQERMIGGAGDPTVAYQSTETPTSGLSVRCPHCHAPMRVAVDTPLTDLLCESCGSRFSIAGDHSQTRSAPSVSRVGHFELIERLGVGGFGSVWKARDTQLDRAVAIKLPRQGDMSDDDTEKFLREARAAAQLCHPNIVAVHEVGRDGDAVYIVSDLVRGLTLDDWLTGQQPTAREAAELTAKIADALHHAHEQGVVHRDLKPGNIMLDGSGEPHLMDFGLARREVGEVTVTLDGQVLGTPAYMSPEQAGGDSHQADRRSDVYSLGVVLFKLLTGELPFRGNARMIMHQVIHEEPPSPRKLNGNVPRDLETITLKCLEKDPGRRYASAKQVNTDLECWLQGRPISARPAGPLERFYTRVKRRPASATLGLLLVALAIGGPAIAIRQTVLTAENRRLAEDRSITLRQIEVKNRELRDQSAASTFQLATTRYADGRVAEAVTLLAEAHRTATPASTTRAYCRTLIPGWLINLNQPLVHKETVRDVAFGPQGKTVATASYDCSARLWDAETGRPVGSPLAHPDGVLCVAFSPSGDRVLTGCQDGKVRFWNTDSCAEVLPSIDVGESVRSIAFNPSETQVVTAGHDSAAKIWDLRTRRSVGKAMHHERWVFGVDWSPDGSMIATASFDETARVWDAVTQEPLTPPLQHVDRVYSTLFLPDGKSLLTTGRFNAPVVWEISSGEVLRRLPVGTWGYDAAVRPDGLAYFAGLDGTVARVSTEGVREPPLSHGGMTLSVAYSQRTGQLASGGMDDRARLWNPSSAECLEPLAHSVYAGSTFLSRSGSIIIDAPQGQPVLIRNTCMNTKRVTSHTLRGAYPCVAFARDEQSVYIGSSSQLLVVDTESGEKIAGFSFPSEQVSCVAVTPDQGPVVALRSDVDTDYASNVRIRIVRALTGEVINELGPIDRATCDSLDATGSHYAVAAKGGDVWLWNVPTGELILDGVAQHAAVNRLVFSPDGLKLAVGTTGAIVPVYEVASGIPLSRIDGAWANNESRDHQFISFSPDSSRIMTQAGTDGALIWEVQSGKPIGPVTAPVRNGLAWGGFSEDGAAVLMQSWNGSLWRSPAPPAPLPDEQQLIDALVSFRTALRLDGSGNAVPLSQSEWLAAGKRLDELASSRRSTARESQ